MVTGCKLLCKLNTSRCYVGFVMIIINAYHVVNHSVDNHFNIGGLGHFIQ
jgi:hypothetical protein